MRATFHAGTPSGNATIRTRPGEAGISSWSSRASSAARRVARDEPISTSAFVSGSTAIVTSASSSSLRSTARLSASDVSAPSSCMTVTTCTNLRTMRVRRGSRILLRASSSASSASGVSSPALSSSACGAMSCSAEITSTCMPPRSRSRRPSVRASSAASVRERSTVTRRSSRPPASEAPSRSCTRRSTSANCSSLARTIRALAPVSTRMTGAGSPVASSAKTASRFWATSRASALRRGITRTGREAVRPPCPAGVSSCATSCSATGSTSGGPVMTTAFARASASARTGASSVACGLRRRML